MLDTGESTEVKPVLYVNLRRYASARDFKHVCVCACQDTVVHRHASAHALPMHELPVEIGFVYVALADTAETRSNTQEDVKSSRRNSNQIHVRVSCCRINVCT